MDMIGDGFHVLAHFLISDSCVYLGSFDVRVPEHSRHGLHGNTQAQHQCGKRMACHMAGEILIDSAHIRNLFQVGVHLLVGENRQQSTLLVLALIFFQYPLRYLEQRDIAGNTCLVS